MATRTGRPPLLNAPIGTNDAGETITVADRIINALRAGAYFEQACAFAGIHRDTAYGWLQTAGRIRIRTAGAPDPTELTAHEADCLRFSDSVAEADAQWEVGTLLTLERLGRGGIPQIKTVIKRGPSPGLDPATGEVILGPELERTVTTEHTLPNWQVLVWRLERRIPKRYRRPGDQDADRGDTGEGLTLEDRQEAMLESVDLFLAGAAEGAAAQRADAKPKTKPRRRRRAAGTEQTS